MSRDLANAWWAITEHPLEALIALLFVCLGVLALAGFWGSIEDDERPHA